MHAHAQTRRNTRTENPLWGCVGMGPAVASPVVPMADKRTAMQMAAADDPVIPSRVLTPSRRRVQKRAHHRVSSRCPAWTGLVMAGPGLSVPLARSQEEKEKTRTKSLPEPQRYSRALCHGSLAMPMPLLSIAGGRRGPAGAPLQEAV